MRYRLAILAILMGGATIVIADPPAEIRFQAHLTDDQGVPLSGTHDFVFRIFDQAANGNNLWTDSQSGVSVNSGAVDVLLPVTAGVLAASERWLEVEVDTKVLSPRQKLASVPFALAAETLGSSTLVDVQNDMDSRIGVHSAIPAAHHVKTTDATELTAGTLDNSRLNMGSGGGIDADLLDGREADELCIEAACNRSSLQIAMLRWYEINESGNTFAIGDAPEGAVFDGESVWVANYLDGEIKSISVADGTISAPITVEASPRWIVYDGRHLWVTHESGTVVSKVEAASGAKSTVEVGGRTFGGCFDGRYIWVVMFDTDEIKRIDPRTDALHGTPVSTGSDPQKCAYDGTDIWVSNSLGDSLTRIDAATGTVVTASISVGDQPHSVVFDGEYIWVANSQVADSTVWRIDRSTETMTHSVPVGTTPRGMVFDGVNIWVASQDADSVTKIRARDAANLGQVSVGAGPRTMVFDGAHVWVLIHNGDAVTKL